MKPLKLALVATFVAFVMVNAASADGFKKKPKPVKVVNITQEKALHHPGPVATIYARIDKKEILHFLRSI